MKNAKYRFNDQTGEVFIYDKINNQYNYCGKLNGRSKRLFIEQYEQNNSY